MSRTSRITACGRDTETLLTIERSRRNNAHIRDTPAVRIEIPEQHLVVDRVARLNRRVTPNAKWANNRTGWRSRIDRRSTFPYGNLDHDVSAFVQHEHAGRLRNVRNFTSRRPEAIRSSPEPTCACRVNCYADCVGAQLVSARAGSPAPRRARGLNSYRF